MFKWIGKTVIAIRVLLVEAAVYAIALYYCAKFAVTAVETGRQTQIGTGYWTAWPIIMAPLSFGLMLLEVLRLMTQEAKNLLA